MNQSLSSGEASGAVVSSPDPSLLQQALSSSSSEGGGAKAGGEREAKKLNVSLTSASESTASPASSNARTSKKKPSKVPKQRRSSGSNQQQQVKEGTAIQKPASSTISQKQPSLGESAGIALLLSNHSSFGLAERVCYHFDLIETLRRPGDNDSIGSGSRASSVSEGKDGNNGVGSPNKVSSEAAATGCGQQKQHSNAAISAASSSSSSFCGVSALLECVPQIPPNKQTKRSRKLLRNSVREFNLQARLASSGVAGDHGAGPIEDNIGNMSLQSRFGPLCYQPPSLPLRPKPTTRVTFAYEQTSIVICLDASSTITSTFGNLGSHHSDDGAVCALDRLGGMVRRYLTGLVEPVPGASAAMNPSKGGGGTGTRPTSGVSGSVGSSGGSSANRGGSGPPSWWIPELCVTVLAAFPRASSLDTGSVLGHDGDNEETRSRTSLLVRDYRVTDTASAEELADAIDSWALSEVEGQIASRLAMAGGRSNDRVDSMMTSSLRDLLEVCDYALVSTLPPEGRPTIVVCTDCRSVVCDSVLDTLVEIRRTDVPLHVLDLSAPHSHHLYGAEEGSRSAPSDGIVASSHRDVTNPSPQLSFLTFDDDGPGTFPLGMSDDAEALYDVCRATGGCFLDRTLLDEAASTIAGQVPSDSTLHGDHYLAFRRRTLRPNALQWYTIFCLSPLTPLYNTSWGRLPPPTFLRQNQTASSKEDKLESLRPSRQNQQDQLVRKGNHSRTAFSMYSLSPVRAKSIILMRIIEGFRARRYGQNTQDADKVSVHFTVPLEFGTVLHYELSYIASPFYNVMVGSAHVKVELSGDPSFIQSVKNDFISHHVNLQQRARHGTIAQRNSAKLCMFLRWIRKEDCLDSYLTPLEWGEKLQVGSPFLRRLGTLNKQQRHRHFDVVTFEVVCTGGDPFSNQESLLSEFREEDSGENELFEIISDFSTQTISDQRCYVLKLPSSRLDLVMYCIVEVKRSSEAARLFTVALEFFGCQDEHERIAVTQRLKEKLYSCAFVVVLPQKVDHHLRTLKQRGARSSLQTSQDFLHKAHWDLTKDSELIPILCQRRRSSIGNFWLFDSSRNHALLGKFVAWEDSNSREGRHLSFVIYAIQESKESVSVDIFMETQRGHLHPFCFSPRSVSTNTNRRSSMPTYYEFFERVKRRDQECALALKSRRRLLSVFRKEESTGVGDETLLAKEQEEDVFRLLSYATSATKRLRFFNAGAGSANDKLATLTLKTILSAAVASTDIAELLISPESKLGACEAGTWFLIRHDKHTLSLVHLALQEESSAEEATSRKEVYRNLTFHTVYAADLYQTKDEDDFDGGEGEERIEDEHAEHLGVSEFAHSIEKAHAKNYARALYLSLRSREEGLLEKVDPDDFLFAIGLLREVKVTDVYISAKTSDVNEDGTSPTGSALSALIATMLEPVPGGGAYFYFKGDDGVTDMLNVGHTSGFDRIHDLSVPYGGAVSVGEETRSEGSPTTNEDDVMSFSSEENDQDDFALIGEMGQSASVDSEDGSPQSIPPPVLIRFLIDGREATFDDLSRLQSSSSISAYITLFKTTGNDQSEEARTEESSRLPRIHAAVALKLVTELKSFVADQNLERLRQVGSNISEIDLRTAILCLLEAKYVASSRISLEFFVAETDELVLASAPTGNERVLDNFLTLLCSEIETQRTIKLRRITEGGGDFFVTSEGDSALPYWCFIQLQRGMGRILLNVHHPGGIDRATEVAERTKAAIKQVCRRVNQIMLLESLHRTRNASYMLIKEDSSSDIKGGDRKAEEKHESHHHQRPGEFACPVKFQTTFFLYHRCSRKTAVLALESKVLHNFAVSNRRGLFVYKDEDTQVFYMRLSSFVNADGTEGILLLVHGAHMPGPSITVQLCRLLERMLFSISLEALSSVLTKNPFYPLLQVDIAFIKEFEAKWSVITENDESDNKKCLDAHRIYEFPDNVDPMLVLMYFRQNICGSGFFHHLNEAEPEDESDTDICGVATAQAASESDRDGDGVDLPFETKHFALFYNNSPSQVDPTYQPVSTLTKKGDEYRKKSGSGIALVQVQLLRQDGTPVRSIRTGATMYIERGRVNYPMELMRMKKIESTTAACSDTSLGEAIVPAAKNYRVSVRITNTLLDCAILQSWIELSLNQSLVGHRVEEVLLQSKQIHVPVASPEPNVSWIPEQGKEANTLSRSTEINSLCSGLPALHCIILQSFDLPHPAVARIELKRNPIKATLLAPLTLSLLDQGLMEGLHSDKKGSGHRGVSIIRITPAEKAKLVTLIRDASAGCVRIAESNSKGKTNVIDKPMDSPEYIVAFGLDRESDDFSDRKRRSSNISSQLVFRELFVEEATTAEDVFARKLAELKASRPDLFLRSLAFIMHVRRSSRIIHVYNWKPDSLSSVIKRLESIEEEVIQSDNRLSSMQQARCLRGLDLFNHLEESSAGGPMSSSIEPSKSDKVSGSRVGKSRGAEQASQDGAKVDKAKKSSARSAPPRKIRRPTNILKPTLIGKSVEGSAMQALAASRARASARKMPGQLRPSSAMSGRASVKPSTKSAPKPTTKTKKDAAPARKEAVEQTKALATRPPYPTAQTAKTYKIQSIPAKLIEYYSTPRTIYSSSVLKRRIPVSVSQQLVSKFMMYIQQEKSMVEELKFILGSATPIFLSSCEISQCGKDKVLPFLMSFAQSIVKKNRNATILSIDRGDMPLVYVKQDLAGSRSCKAILVLELTATRHSTTREFVARCRCWLFIQTSQRKIAAGVQSRSRSRMRSSKSKRRKNRALTKFEKTPSALQCLAKYYCENLHMRSEFFNFSASLLKSSEKIVTASNPLQLLRMLMHRYPPFLQRELPSLNYRILHDRLRFGTFVHGDKEISVDMMHLFGYLCSHPPSRWSVVECNNNQRLLMGDITASEVPARFFLTLDNNNNGSAEIELFVLCAGESPTLDEYVVSEDQIYAERLSAKVLRMAAISMGRAIRSAAVNLRRDTLWANHSLSHNFESSSINAEDAIEMCYLSSQTSLTMIDPRLISLLSDDSDLDINWSSAFFSMRQDPLFSHCLVFQVPGKTTTAYLFHFAHEDKFLMFELNTDGRMVAANILLREECVDDATKATKCKAVELVVNWILHWMWHNF